MQVCSRGPSADPDGSALQGRAGAVSASGARKASRRRRGSNRLRKEEQDLAGVGRGTVLGFQSPPSLGASFPRDPGPQGQGWGL